MAASLDDLTFALQNADKAGDAEGARMLAAEIQRMQSAEAPAKQDPSIVTPTPMQKRMGIRNPRKKDDQFIQNVAQAAGDAGYDVGGAVTDATGSPALGYVANIATDTVPSLIGGAVTKAPLVMDAAKNVGRRAMQIALKPNWEALRTGKAADAIETMLQGGFNATKGGVEAMKGKIANLNDEIAAMVKDHPGVIQPHKVAERVKGLADDALDQVTPNKDTAAIREAVNEFLNHPHFAQNAEISVERAQKMKQGTYKALGNKSYGELKSADVEVQKALARGLKEELSDAVPGIAGKNAAEGKLINATNIAERRAMLQDNNNLGGLVWLAHDPVAAVGYMADKSAGAMSLLGRGMYSGAIPGSIGEMAGGLLGAYTATPNEGILSRRRAWMGSEAESK